MLSATEILKRSDDLPARLADALAGERAAAAARRRFAPALSYGRHEGPPPDTARSAAVMVLLFRRAGRWHVPLTVRPTSLSQHGGQISLPGGTVEPTESSHEAAARELFEELGVDDAVKLLGQLSDCYVFASDFVVTPWVAAAAGEPRWRIGEREVQRIVEMPLDLLLDDEACGRMTIQRGPLAFHAPCYCVGDDRVWGATSVILGELAAVLRGLAKTL